MSLFDDFEEEQDDTLVVPERGFFGDLGTGLLRGVTETIGLAGEAAESLGLENSVDEWAEDKMETSPWLAPDVSEYQEGTGIVGEAAQSLGTSLSAVAGPAATGAAMGSFLGPAGTIAGGFVGGGIGLFSIFGAGMGRRNYEKGLEAGLSEDEAIQYGWDQAKAEVGGELIATVADVFTAGLGGKALKAGKPFLRKMLKMQPKELAKTFGTMLLTENATELGQNEAANMIDQKYGLTDEGLSWGDRLHTMAVASLVGGTFGTVGAAYTVTERVKLKNQLENGTLDEQYAAAKSIKSQMDKQGLTEEAEHFDSVISDAIKAQIPIRVDQDFAMKAQEIARHGESFEAAEAKTEAYQPDVPEGVINAPVEKINEILEDAGIPVADNVDQEQAGIVQPKKTLDDALRAMDEAKAKRKAEVRKPWVGQTDPEMAQVPGEVPGDPVDTAQPETAQVGFGQTPPEMAQVQPDRPRVAEVTPELAENLGALEDAKAEQTARVRAPMVGQAGPEMAPVQPDATIAGTTGPEMVPVPEDTPRTPAEFTGKLRENLEMLEEAKSRRREQKEPTGPKVPKEKEVPSEEPTAPPIDKKLDEVREKMKVALDKGDDGAFQELIKEQTKLLKAKDKAEGRGETYVSPEPKETKVEEEAPDLKEKISEKDIKKAEDIMAMDPEEKRALDPADLKEAEDILKKSGRTIKSEDPKGEATALEEKVIKETSRDPQGKKAVEGDWKGLEEETRAIAQEKGITHKEARGELLKELSDKFPEARQIMENSLADFERTPEGKVDRRTFGSVTWDIDPDVSHGVSTDGTKYFIQKHGKNKHELFKGKESMGIFKTRQAAMESTTEDLSAYTIHKFGKNRWGVKLNGKLLSTTGLRTKKNALILSRLHGQNPEMPIASTITRMNKGEKLMDMAIEEDSIPEIVDFDEVDAFLEDEFGEIEELPDLDEPTYDRGNIINVNQADEKYAKLFQGILHKLNVKTPDIYAIDSQNFFDNPASVTGENLPTWIDNIFRNRRKNPVASTGWDPESNSAVIVINKEKFNRLSKMAQAQVIAHEAGHIVERVHFHNAPEKVQQGIIDEYLAIIEEELKPLIEGGTVSREQLMTMFRPEILGAESLEASVDSRDMVYGLSEDFFQYVTSFSEYFADQTAKWASTNREPQGVIETFFEGVGRKLRELYSLILNRTFKGYARTNMKKFLDYHVEQSKRQSDIVPEHREVVMDNAEFLLTHKGLQSDKNRILGVTQWDDQYGGGVISDMRIDAERERLAVKKGIVPYTTEEARAYFKENAKKKKSLERKVRETTKTLVKGAKSTFKSGIDTIEGYSPKIAKKVNDYVLGISQKNAEYKGRVDGFSKVYKSMPVEDQQLLGMALSNSHRPTIGKLEAMYPGLKEELMEVRKVLDEINGRAEAVAYHIDKPIADYFPRSVLDPLGLKNHIDGTIDRGKLETEIAEARREAEAAGIEWTPMHEEELINSIMQTGRYAGALATPKSLKKRGIIQLTPAMMQYYANPIRALNEHILQMNDAIGAQELIGGKARKGPLARLKVLEKRLNSMPKGGTGYKNAMAEWESLRSRLASTESDSILQESLSKKIHMEAKAENLTYDQAQEIMELVRARILEKGMHGLPNSFRNVGLISTLADFTSVITQASEVILNAYANNPVNALMGMVKKKEIDAAMMDLKNQQLEFQSEGSAKWVSKVLDMTGFSKTDIFMKESFMNSALLKARKQSKKELREDWGAYFGDQFDELHKELQEGTVGPRSTEMAWAKLMKYQPLDVIANPKAYMEGGNLRILYMLKTFQLRQANAIYREGITKILKGDKKKGLMNLAWLTSLIVLGGATKDELRDLWLGREVPMRDHIWDNVLNIAMLSRYDTERFKSEGIGKQILGKILPPTPWVDYPYKDATKWFEGKESYQSLKLLPVFGKALYDRGTEQGQKQQSNVTKASFNRQLKSAADDPARLREIRKEIREYNKDRPKEERLDNTSVIRTINAERKKRRADGPVARVIYKHSGRMGVDTQVAMENMALFAEIVGMAENSGKLVGKNPDSGARGLFQFTPDSVTTAITRLKRTVGMEPWMLKALEHRDANLLDKEQQTALFIANLTDRAKTDKYLKAIMETGDIDSMTHLYEKEHHTAPDPATKKNWERAIKEIKGRV